MATNKRLEMLENLAVNPTADSFARYALAMEYKSLGRLDEARRTFEELRSRDPRYIPMYLMCGTMLAGQGELGSAKEWLEAGLEEAKGQRNAHAAGELESALLSLASG